MRMGYISPAGNESQRVLHETIFPLPDLPVCLSAYTPENTPAAPHWHDELELLYIRQASQPVEVIVDGQRQTVPQDALLLFNTRAIHETSAIEHALILHIPVSLWKQFVPDYDRYTFSLAQAQPPLLDGLKGRMLEIFAVWQEKRAGYQLRCMALLCSLMDDLFTHCRSAAEPPAGHAPHKRIASIAEVLDYIEQHHAEKLSVADIASRFGYHPNYLSRLFQQSVGYTVLEYIYKIRIHHVYCDMLYTDKTVRRAFEDHGCTNTKVAMRLFKETYRATPRDIRKMKTDRIG